MVKVNVSRTQFSLSIAISVALTPDLRKLTAYYATENR